VTADRATWDVRVPATSANLGPGFDCLGLALGAYLRIHVSPADEIEISGVGPPRPPGRNLTVKSYQGAFRALGREGPPVRFETIEAYPSARGLGASASAIVAGLVAARAVGDLPLTDTELGGLAVAIEGHADNVLPALFGGLLLATGGSWIRFEPASSVAPLILVARKGLRTSEARRVLPESVPRGDAVHNAAATAALVAILSGNASGDLLWATADRLHEPYRLPLMAETRDLHLRLRERGIATALSGAGPSLLCLVDSATVGEMRSTVRSELPDGWGILAPGWDLTGARVD
jgi:homoserine kinase